MFFYPSECKNCWLYFNIQKIALQAESETCFQIWFFPRFGGEKWRNSEHAHASYPGLSFRPPGFSPYTGREERRVQGLDYSHKGTLCPLWYIRYIFVRQGTSVFLSGIFIFCQYLWFEVDYSVSMFYSCDRLRSFVNKVLRSCDRNVSHNAMVSQRAALQAAWYHDNQLSITFYTCVNFGKM